MRAWRATGLLTALLGLLGLAGCTYNPDFPSGKLKCAVTTHQCPQGYTCDMTDTYSALNQQGLYACMPNKSPHALGDSCEGTGDGECGPGLTCSLPDTGPAVATCEAFCDSRDPGACPTGKTCTETVVTMQDNDPNIGVCLPKTAP